MKLFPWKQKKEEVKAKEEDVKEFKETSTGSSLTAFLNWPVNRLFGTQEQRENENKLHEIAARIERFIEESENLNSRLRVLKKISHLTLKAIPVMTTTEHWNQLQYDGGVLFLLNASTAAIMQVDVYAKLRELGGAIIGFGKVCDYISFQCDFNYIEKKIIDIINNYNVLKAADYKLFFDPIKCAELGDWHLYASECLQLKKFLVILNESYQTFYRTIRSQSQSYGTNKLFWEKALSIIEKSDRYMEKISAKFDKMLCNQSKFPLIAELSHNPLDTSIINHTIEDSEFFAKYPDFPLNPRQGSMIIHKEHNLDEVPLQLFDAQE